MGKEFIRILVGKHEGKTPFGRPRRRWKGNIKIDGRVWTGFIWLSIMANCGLLLTQ
jgi:hypothetical protein